MPLVRQVQKQKRHQLVDLPKHAPKKWHQFFRRIGLADKRDEAMH
jgi:hypothetical protein